ncbi:hypothetical protein PROFUN_01987 [Planoprotostelium fungivorum]|uniref:Uncharacterized protein n=1 Tax=Planoprotostelium fungivorum TaxID=1890364 RepID=A0A2P6NB33_9EUKA|nr:hypothetical protein PROFUN_01987 [Planoprotostelium fungivorum]
MASLISIAISRYFRRILTHFFNALFVLMCNQLRSVDCYRMRECTDKKRAKDVVEDQGIDPYPRVVDRQLGILQHISLMNPPLRPPNHLAQCYDLFEGFSASEAAFGINDHLNCTRKCV